MLAMHAQHDTKNDKQNDKKNEAKNEESMLTVCYFASIREKLGCDSERLELPQGADSVQALIDCLADRHGAALHEILNQSSVLVAINQSVARFTSPVRDGDEVAFFPPVTGG